MSRNQTTFVILGILSIHPHQSGYEIRKTIQTTVGFFWGESFGQIYPTLKRLAAEGLIVPSRSSGTGRQRRQEYSLTEAGHACLTEWLAKPYRDDPPRDEFLLKLFFGREAAPTISIGHIHHFQENNRKALAMLLEVEAIGRAKNANHPHFPFWMLTLTFGVAQIRSALAWSESAMAMLAAAETAAGPGLENKEGSLAGNGAAKERGTG